MSEVPARTVTALRPLERPGCSCTCSIAGGEVILRFRGELDIASLAPLHDVLVAAQADGAPVVVDLDGVTFLDSSGLRLLLQASERGSMRVRGGTAAVRRVVAVAGLAEVLGTRSPLASRGGVPAPR